MTAPRMVQLHDDELTDRILRDQAMGRLELRCSVCEIQVQAPWELDDSGRCDTCRP